VSPKLADHPEPTSAVENVSGESQGPTLESSVCARASIRNQLFGGLGLAVVLVIVGLSAYFVLRYLL
jgi:hypothetical protein